MPSKQITSQCSALPPSPSPYATCFVPVVHSKYLSCILRTSWTKLCFSLGSCSHTHTGMAVFAMLKYVAHNIFSSRHIWFRSSCSSLPRAVHFSATPQPCMPSVVPCTAVCNLGCSMSHDQNVSHQAGWCLLKLIHSTAKETKQPTQKSVFSALHSAVDVNYHCSSGPGIFMPVVSQATGQDLTLVAQCAINCLYEPFFSNEC